MARRLNTVIIVPHSKAKFYKFSFSSRTLILAASGTVIGLLLAIAAISFTGNAVGRRAEVRRLQEENQQLAEVNRQLEVTVVSVQSRLEEFEQRTARLALAAGMSTEGVDLGDGASRGGRVGAGGPYDRLPDTPEVLASQGDWIATNLDQVEARLTEQHQQHAGTPSIAPVLGVMTDGFGTRRDPFTGRRATHTGLDLSARIGTPVVAPADGVVVFADRDSGLGRVVRLSHGFGLVTLFGHLDRILVEPGTEVKRGEKIGLLGNTGRSTGPHLHYEVHVDGKPVDPLFYILDAF